MADLQQNIAVLNAELDWLNQVIEQVIKRYFVQEGSELHWRDLPVPELEDETSFYAQTVRDWNLNVYERIALALTLAPHLRPQMLDVFFGRNQLYDRSYTEFGGVVDKEAIGFFPTAQTLNFLVTATNPEWRVEVMNILNPEHILMQEQVLELEGLGKHAPPWGGQLSLSSYWLQYFITGEKTRPELSMEFPAKRITTNLDWTDLVLEHHVMDQVQEVTSWLKHGDTLMNDWGLRKSLKPGFRALFYGPPGTGKTLTASLLGKSSGREVYRVDLSMVISKYIGETEKNLSKVFDAAAYKDWILFFDEADALFGKRTAATNSNDRHANQQTGYLLQRIEDFPGVVILATNLKANMDEAFTRRFQSMIHFSMPTPHERLKLWQNAFSGTCTLDPEIDMEHLAEEYELPGGAIINVLRHSALSAIRRNDTVVKKQELMAGLRREFRKDNRTIKTY